MLEIDTVIATCSDRRNGIILSCSVESKGKGGWLV